MYDSESDDKYDSESEDEYKSGNNRVGGSGANSNAGLLAEHIPLTIVVSREWMSSLPHSADIPMFVKLLASYKHTFELSQSEFAMSVFLARGPETASAVSRLGFADSTVTKLRSVIAAYESDDDDIRVKLDRGESRIGDKLILVHALQTGMACSTIRCVKNMVAAEIVPSKEEATEMLRNLILRDGAKPVVKYVSTLCRQYGVRVEDMFEGNLLIYAISNRMYNLAFALITIFKCDVTSAENGMTPAMHAVNMYNISILKNILSVKQDLYLDTRDERGRTVLMLAKFDSAKILINCGRDIAINAKDTNGKTALSRIPHHRSYNEHRKLLMDAGAK